jgi:membrane protein
VYQFGAAKLSMQIWQVVKKTATEFQQDECPRLAAALAFYTLFSLPALVLSVVSLAGLVVQQQAAEERLTAQIAETMGPTVAEQISSVIHQAKSPGQGWKWITGMVLLLVGATGALVEVQTALNRAWNVESDPEQGGWRGLLMKRVLSLAMLLSIAFLLLVSLVVSWLLTEFGHWIEAHAPGWLSSPVAQTANALFSLAIITLLFAAIFKFVPDVRLGWSDVWSGAIAAALLFVLGKSGMGIYLAWSNPATAFGAAGSLALVLIWIYYSAMVLFLGAELAQVLSQRRGKTAEARAGARRLSAAARSLRGSGPAPAG